MPRREAHRRSRVRGRALRLLLRVESGRENTPTFRSRPGELVQWEVLAMGSAHHTFHVHGHRWRGADRVPLDTRTLGPAESFRVRWREREPGTWLYHCHREDHMERGMIGLSRVSRH